MPAKLKRIQEIVLEISLELAKKGEGALFVIGDDIEYVPLIKQKMERFNILENGAGKILRSIATIDGSIIINKEGEVVAYSAMIKGVKPFLGYGTRHAAAVTASKNNNISIMTSEEEKKVKIFKNGKFVMQMDALQKNIEKEIPRVASFLESLGAGFLGAVGVTTLAPAIGISFLPGVILFGVSYFAITQVLNHLRRPKR